MNEQLHIWRPSGPLGQFEPIPVDWCVFFYETVERDRLIMSKINLRKWDPGKPLDPVLWGRLYRRVEQFQRTRTPCEFSD